MIGAELAARRARLGVTQAELARALAVHPVTVAQWERGVKPIGNGRILRLALDWLADDRAAFGGDVAGWQAHVAAWSARDWRAPDDA